MGVTYSLKSRLEALGNQFEEEINFFESFYYEVPEKIAHSLETSLKNKHKEHCVKSDIYKTEVFQIEAIDAIEEDIESYHELFDYEISKKRFIDKYAMIYDDKGKIRIQYTKRLKQIYDIFKGKEEYFEHIFAEQEKEVDSP
jgi:hypothetical protein